MVTPSEGLTCRVRDGYYYNATFFGLWSCSMCYFFLLKGKAPVFHFVEEDGQLMALAGSGLPLNFTLRADINDVNVVRQVCATMDDEACDRWTSCCRAADQCCKEQTETQIRAKAKAHNFSPTPSSPQTHQHSFTNPSPGEAPPRRPGTDADFSQKVANSRYPGGEAETAEAVAESSSDGDDVDKLPHHGGNGRRLRHKGGERTSSHQHHLRHQPPRPTSSFGYSASMEASGTHQDSSISDMGVVTVDVDTGRRDVCPHTWDGFGCFRETKAGHTATISCPQFIESSDPNAVAHKQCTEDGTWWKLKQEEQEWTDYTSCVQMDMFKEINYVKVTCNVVSMTLLVPACFIFLCYKKLRRQHRIRIHVQLFTSFIFTNVVVMLWDYLVYIDRFQNPKKDTLMYRNTVGCKALNILSRYGWVCNYFWMFLEGYHLHRLIIKAFETPKSMLGYYIVGWGGPWVPILIYAIIRTIRKDKQCWVRNIKDFEWIIYTPTVLCIAVNVLFLISILRILLTQLTPHPNEPSNYRRALKATAVLVPLFGVQLFLVIYWPVGASPQHSRIYEFISSVVTHSQGAQVALIFCFLNKEVLSYLKLLKMRCQACFSRNHKDIQGVTAHTYVMTERGGQGPYDGGSPESAARDQYVAVATQERSYRGIVNGTTGENFV